MADEKQLPPWRDPLEAYDFRLDEGPPVKPVMPTITIPVSTLWRWLKKRLKRIQDE